MIVLHIIQNLFFTEIHIFLLVGFYKPTRSGVITTQAYVNLTDWQVLS